MSQLKVLLDGQVHRGVGSLVHGGIDLLVHRGVSPRTHRGVGQLLHRGVGCSYTGGSVHCYTEGSAAPTQGVLSTATQRGRRTTTHGVAQFCTKRSARCYTQGRSPRTGHFRSYSYRHLAMNLGMGRAGEGQKDQVLKNDLSVDLVASTQRCQQQHC
jgi:O-acetyl-ADP-ribose deacetylase (regulator of RNase III)